MEAREHRQVLSASLVLADYAFFNLNDDGAVIAFFVTSMGAIRRQYMTTLIERFKAASGGGHPRCSVSVVLGSLDNKAAAQLTTAIQDATISGAAISTVMRDEGHELSAFSVRRHRRRECACS
jgi:hypothetical protein